LGGPKQVLSYLANYTHRVALSNRRILAVDAQHQSVTFTYRDYRHGSQRKDLTLSAFEFIRRFSLHILPPGLVRIRNYGILAFTDAAGVLQMIGAGPMPCDSS
jgi:hypothetical protein